MADSEKNQRKTLRNRVTRKVNKINNEMQNMPLDELEADLDILKEFQVDLRKLDDKILNVARADSSVTSDQVEHMEDECDDYIRKIKVCINKISVQMNALRAASHSHTGNVFSKWRGIT